MMEGQAYGDAVEELRQASGGRYAGPCIHPQEVKQALGGAAGIDPGAIGQHLGFAVGATDTSRLGKGWLGGVLQVLQHLAFGLIGDAVGKGIREWWQNREDAQRLTHEAEQATEAMRDICATSDTAAAEILAALSQNVTALSNHLRCLAPQAGPEQAAAFHSALGVAANVIDQAGSSVMELCRERNDALAGCMEELERKVSAVCEAPQPCGPAAVVSARAERSCPPTEREAPSAGVSPAPPASVPDASPGNGSGTAPGVEAATARAEHTPVEKPETACPEPRATPAAASQTAPPAASAETEPQTRHAAREEGCSVPPRGASQNTSPAPRRERSLRAGEPDAGRIVSRGPAPGVSGTGDHGGGFLWRAATLRGGRYRRLACRRWRGGDGDDPERREAGRGDGRRCRGRDRSGRGIGGSFGGWPAALSPAGKRYPLREPGGSVRAGGTADPTCPRCIGERAGEYGVR
ncbi:hypothetical protein V5T06_05285 [Corynebacterium mastitidis]